MIGILGILLVHFALSKFVQVMGYQPSAIYYESFILGAWTKQLLSIRYGLPILTCILFLILYRSRIWFQWTALDAGASLRLVLTGLAAVLTWRYAFYDFNLYYFQGYYWDRLILIGLLFCIYYRPIFILPFLLMLRLVINQFEIIPGFSWAESSMPIAILTLFLTFFIVYVLSRRFIIGDFVFLLICLLAAHYWLPGLGKMSYLWITEDQVKFLIPSSQANGWLKSWSDEEINSFMSVMAALNTPLKILTLLLEFGAMFIFLRRRLVLLFIIGWIGMHVTIFWNTGICFWIWSATILMIFYFLGRKNSPLAEIKFTSLDIVLGMILIIGGSYWNRIVKLAWFDTPLTYVYQYEATNKEGETFQLAHHFFAPYDYQFTINSMSYLCDMPLLNTSSPLVFRDIMNVKSSDELFALEQKSGINQFNGRKSKQLRGFLSQYIQNWNKRRSNRTALSILEAPRLLWTSPLEFEEEKIGEISSIKVVQVTFYYINGRNEVFREKDVLEISTLQ